MARQIFVNFAVKDLYREATDHRFMYHHAFEDLDGHIWEVAHLKGST